MRYYFSTRVNGNFQDVIDKVTGALKEEGFGVLTEIDVKATLKKKLDVDFRPYKILGACNPPFAYKALQAEPKIGTMLPCNVVLEEVEPDVCEVTAVDPIASMMAIQNPQLEEIASQIRDKLKRVIESL